MATLAECMLETAKIITMVHDGTIKSFGTNYFVDDDCQYQSSYFENGTVFITSGSAVDNVRTIISYAEGKFVYSGSSMDLSVGDTYSAAYGDFTLNDIKQACVTTVNNVMLMKEHSGIKVANGECVLPDGVSNIRRVIGSDGKRNRYWDEIGGKLIFDNTSYQDTIKVLYASRQSIKNLSDEISQYIDIEYIVWASVAFLWRRYIERHMKDNQVAVELLNEAKNNELNALAKSKRYLPSNIPRDARFSMV